MSQIACKYHYDLPARWSCHACRINFCTNCVTPHQEQTPYCVVCGEPLAVVGAENVVSPFWQRLHYFFMYPVNAVPMGIMLLLVAVVAAFGNTLFGILAVVLSILVFMKYAYVVLEDTSHGYLLPRAFSLEMITNDLELPFKHILNIFLIIALNYMVYNYSREIEYDYLFYAILSATLFFLPTSVMVLAVKHSFTSAFNPLLHFHIVRSIGFAYVLLYAFLFMMLSSVAAAIYYVNLLIPSDFYLMIDIFISMFFLLSIFNMLGYVLYQYHEKIGFGIDVAVSSSELEAGDGSVFKLRMPMMADIEVLVQEGEYKQAMKRLEKLITEHPSDMHARGYYQKLLHLLGDVDAARAHCADFVGRLMDENKITQAMNVFIACYKQDPEITLAKPSQRLAMASVFVNSSKHRLAMHLLNNLHKDHPAYSEIPEAYLMVARIMSDQFNQDDKAINILEFVLERYQQNKGIEAVQEYLNILKSVTQSDKF
ncbi:hypothetical protein MNBD_GAMMA23-600 [hydrothermal vent metagenome]|uniref:B box-type domain-containing protein n=1 Tax=hydrothermal vent metagenome TaxID=652676 RepID=A0A3B0ZW23_9ZZZZ